MKNYYSMLYPLGVTEDISELALTIEAIYLLNINKYVYILLYHKSRHNVEKMVP